jgi:hypothetical protein
MEKENCTRCKKTWWCPDGWEKKVCPPCDEKNSIYRAEKRANTVYCKFCPNKAVDDTLYCNKHKGKVEVLENGVKCSGCLNKFIPEPDYKYKQCPNCQINSVDRKKRYNEKQKQKKNITKCKYDGCTYNAAEGKDYCLIDQAKIDKVKQLQLEEETGLFICASRYKCDEKVNGKDIKCEKCKQRTRDYDNARHKEKLNKNKASNGVKLCTLCPLTDNMRPITDFMLIVVIVGRSSELKMLEIEQVE